MSQGEIIAFINYVTQILLALIVVSNLVIIFTKASSSANRVNEVLSVKASVSEDGNVVMTEPDHTAPAISFDHVSFGYNTTGELALEDISVVINRGETVGLIGSTGSGKSTFVNLIPRFYDAVQGS